ncbi:MAG: hypothetical protein KatS3mg067_2285 [Thermosynechococcus sp.]|uniref:hypothetical protein n=1 Tax=Thermosynechococcus sp. TaxID=2814275 RepID=UPI00220550CE|nr:hypothetical protein [Thermosynechococcus sp.]BCX13347.1 MAG: hypothetical protein KatS3mg067_2285 [Thermosynechococcus sp.]
MAVSYQSRFFSFWRQQWQRWQQRWQRQQWQIESTLSGTLQVIGSILAQFWQQRVPQLLGTVSQMHQRLLPKPTAAPPADEALLTVMSALSLTPGEDQSWVVAIAPIARPLNLVAALDGPLATLVSIPRPRHYPQRPHPWHSGHLFTLPAIAPQNPSCLWMRLLAP